MTTTTTALTAAQPGAAEDVLRFITSDNDIIVPIGFGEPPTLLDTIEDHATELNRVRIHQMDPFTTRRYIRGEFGDHLRHIDYYLGAGSRQAFWEGACDLVPNHFSEMPLLLRRVHPSLVIARAAGPDEHGYFSLGTNADYTATFIGQVPFFLEVLGVALVEDRRGAWRRWR
jgi:acyl-CoA hydrolase